jgi:hypothetical protein
MGDGRNERSSFYQKPIGENLPAVQMEIINKRSTNHKYRDKAEVRFHLILNQHLMGFEAGRNLFSENRELKQLCTSYISKKESF